MSGRLAGPTAVPRAPAVWSRLRAHVRLLIAPRMSWCTIAPTLFAVACARIGWRSPVKTARRAPSASERSMLRFWNMVSRGPR
jgi:hypothetical protein